MAGHRAATGRPGPASGGLTHLTVVDHAVLRDLALDIARAVGPEIGRRAGRVDVSSTKSTASDLVTEVDRWSEDQIVSRILDARPGDSILGEEGTGVEGTSNIRWVVDPIDGTTDFVYGHPGFSISIGVEVDSQPVVGVVLDPLLEDEFAAAVGHGTTRNGQQVWVSGTTDLTAALVATGFSYDPDRRGRQAEVLVGLLPQIRDIRRMGGAATDLASVSCGRVDAYFEQGLNPWDCAAGTVLVSEAGGRVTDLDGRPSTGEMMVAAPAAIHGPLLDLLQTVGADRV